MLIVSKKDVNIFAAVLAILWGALPKLEKIGLQTILGLYILGSAYILYISGR